MEDWGKLLGDTAAVSALLDRLLRYAHVLQCGPRSWRTHHATSPQHLHRDISRLTAALDSAVIALGGKLDDSPVVRAASQRALHAIVHALAAGRRPDPALTQRAAIACAALEGVVRSAIDDDPERLRAPRGIEQVVHVAVGAMTAAR